MTIKAKFAGNCKLCGSSWEKEEDIHYNKDPRAVCIKEDCYWQQRKAGKGSGNVASKPTFEIKNPEVEVQPDVKQSGEIVLQAITLAHDMATQLNVGIETDSHTFGQIRSKLTDQILFALSIK
jgi:ribosome-binding protein aMBF1 (putative translation factor)